MKTYTKESKTQNYRPNTDCISRLCVSMPAPKTSVVQKRDWGGLGGTLINNSSRNIRFWTGDNAEENPEGSVHGTAEILPAHTTSSSNRDIDMFEWRGIWYKVKNLITAEVDDESEVPRQSLGSIARGAGATVAGGILAPIIANRWSQGLRPATIEEIGYVRVTRPEWF